LVVGGGYQRIRFPKDGGAGVEDYQTAPSAVPLTAGSKVEIRTFERRYITIDGKPIGAPVDDALEGAPPPR
jgi:hypothetical protein